MIGHHNYELCIRSNQNWDSLEVYHRGTWSPNSEWREMYSLHLVAHSSDPRYTSVRTLLFQSQEVLEWEKPNCGKSESWRSDNGRVQGQE